MPTYDYECDACKHCFEEFQSMSDEVLKKCPQCKKKKLRRLIGTGAAIQARCLECEGLGGATASASDIKLMDFLLAKVTQ